MIFYQVLCTETPDGVIAQGGNLILVFIMVLLSVTEPHSCCITRPSL